MDELHEQVEKEIRTRHNVLMVEGTILKEKGPRAHKALDVSITTVIYFLT